MAGAFIKLLNMSIAASWLVLAVLLLRFVLKKAPKWVNPLLWGRCRAAPGHAVFG